MKKALVLLVLVSFLSLSVSAFAQKIVVQPELPAGYADWPNKFEKNLNEGSHILNFGLWVKKYTGSNNVETMLVFKIDGTTVLTMHAYNSNGKAIVVVHELLREGYAQIGNLEPGANLDERSKRAETFRLQELSFRLQVLSMKAIEQRFGLQIEGPYGVMDLLEANFRQELEDFFAKLKESEKPK